MIQRSINDCTEASCTFTIVNHSVLGFGNRIIQLLKLKVLEHFFIKNLSMFSSIGTHLPTPEMGPQLPLFQHPPQVWIIMKTLPTFLTLEFK